MQTFFPSSGAVTQTSGIQHTNPGFSLTHHKRFKGSEKSQEVGKCVSVLNAGCMGDGTSRNSKEGKNVVMCNLRSLTKSFPTYPFYLE